MARGSEQRVDDPPVTAPHDESPSPRLMTEKTSRGPRRLSMPRRVTVDAGPDGSPAVVDGRKVGWIRESWLVEDRWWTDKPLRRHYWEIVTTCGRNEVVFCDLRRGRWWRQRV